MVTNASTLSSFNRLCLFFIWMIFIVQQGTSARKLATIPDKTGVQGRPSQRAPSATGQTYPPPQTTSPYGNSNGNSNGNSYGNQQNCGYVRRCTVSPYGGESCGYDYTCTSTDNQNCNTYTRCNGANNCATYTNCQSSSSPNEECVSGTCYTEP